MIALLAEKMLVLFAILALGTWIGRLSMRGVSLGTAGVLFTAMLFGHFGLAVPQEVMESARCACGCRRRPRTYPVSWG